MRGGYKRSQKTNPVGDPLPNMPEKGATLKGNMSRRGGTSAKPMMGAKSTKAGKGANITSQGERAGGMTAGRSRTNVGRNNIGKGRQQAM